MRGSWIYWSEVNFKCLSFVFYPLTALHQHDRWSALLNTKDSMRMTLLFHTSFYKKSPKHLCLYYQCELWRQFYFCSFKTWLWPFICNLYWIWSITNVLQLPQRRPVMTPASLWTALDMVTARSLVTAWHFSVIQATSCKARTPSRVCGWRTDSTGSPTLLHA